MQSRTTRRIKSSISTKVALVGVGLVIVAAVLGTFPGAGVWSGITALVGAYITLLAIVSFGVLEFLRISGY